MKKDRRCAAPPLIRTKFKPPRLTRTPVPRERAIAVLRTGLERDFVLVRAPAGFGKTTLLTTWRETLVKESRVVAWLTLDHDDNDPLILLDYLCAALAPVLLRSLSELTLEEMVDGVASVTAKLAVVINAIDAFEDELVLILDEYDKIAAAEAQALFAYLLTHMPPNLHLVMACRANPPLPLALLGAAGRMVEVDSDVLRFDIEQSRAFLCEAIPFELSQDDSRAIHDITEGWAAGLQMASLALPERASLDHVLGAFPRRSPTLCEYLAENVLTRLPQDTVDFMLRTSILHRLNGTLCEALTGTTGAAERLEWLVRKNLFLQPLEGEEQWYRYHGLFAEFLQLEAQRRLGAELKGLHLRAAIWFSERELWAEAVRHALDAERVDLAVEWLERCTMGELRGSRVRNLLSWIQRLPESALRRCPNLRITQIWALILTVQTHEADRLVNQFDGQLASSPSAESAQLRRILKAQRVSILSMQDNVGPALALAQEVWDDRFAENRPPADGFDWVDEAFLNSMISLNRKVGRLDVAKAVCDFYQADHTALPNYFMMSYRAAIVASLELHLGRPLQAIRRLEETLAVCERHAGRRSAAASLTAAMLASCYYDCNRLDDVEALLANRFDVIDDVCYLDAVESAYISLARARLLRGNHAAAHALLDRAEALAVRRCWPRLTASCTAERLRLWLLAGRSMEAERAIDKLQALESQLVASRPDCNDVTAPIVQSRARWLLYRGDAAGAARVLAAALADDAVQRGLTPTMGARLRGAYAVALHHCAQDARAEAVLEEALVLAAPAGAVRALLDEGEAILPVLGALMRRCAGTALAAFCQRLCDARAFEACVSSSVNDADGGGGSDAFSRRELDILDLVAQRMSNKEIARSLCVAPETVKWHLKNIFRKSGVSDRQLAARLRFSVTPGREDAPVPRATTSVHR